MWLQYVAVSELHSQECGQFDSSHEFWLQARHIWHIWPAKCILVLRISRKYCIGIYYQIKAPSAHWSRCFGNISIGLSHLKNWLHNHIWLLKVTEPRKHQCFMGQIIFHFRGACFSEWILVQLHPVKGDLESVGSKSTLHQKRRKSH